MAAFTTNTQLRTLRFDLIFWILIKEMPILWLKIPWTFFYKLKSYKINFVYELSIYKNVYIFLHFKSCP